MKGYVKCVTLPFRSVPECLAAALRANSLRACSGSSRWCAASPALSQEDDMGASLRIGVDVDDVLVESLPGYLQAFRSHFGRDVRIEDAAWEIFPRYPDISTGEMWTFFATLEETNFLGTRPVYPEAPAAVRALAGAGHRLVVVTGRLSEHRHHTQRLLESAGIAELFEDLVHRDGETAAEYKPRVIRERRLDLLIDDELHVAVAAARVPVPVLLFDRPWNQGELPGVITRVSSWSQILRCVAAAAATCTTC